MKLPDTVLQQLKDPGLLDFMDYVSIILNSGRYELRVVNQVPTWAAAEGESVLYANGADLRVYYYLDGAWHFAAFIGGGLLLSTLSDAAAATLVQVEKTTADLTIRFTANSIEQIDITDGKMAPVATNYVDLGDGSHRFKTIYCETLDYSTLNPPVSTASDIDGGSANSVYGGVGISPIDGGNSTSF
jgi:hypothetical protein